MTSTFLNSTPRRLRFVLPLLPLIGATAIQWALHDFIKPHVWLLFYPALYLSTWIGDMPSSLVVTFLYTGVIWRVFLPAEPVPSELLGMIVFAATGILFTVFHNRLRRSNRRLTSAMEERRVFAALIENSSDFIGIADPDGTPIYVNPAGRQMVGLDADYPVQTTSIPDYYPGDQRPFASEVIVKAMVERGHWEGETFFRHWRTEASIPVSDTHFMIRDPETQRVLGMGTITRDISEIRAARLGIEVANRKLEQANEHVTRLYEKMKELDELKTQFFSSVSHELRTPLALILGPVEKQLRATPGPAPELQRDLEVIERNARTILRHVNDLLDIASLDAGRLRAEYSEVDAAMLTRAAADHFSALAAEQHIQFVVEAPAALQIQTDRDKFDRMVLNLLSNAFKFTPAGGRIRITLSEADDRVVLEVGDSGPGVPVIRRDEVFERFRQFNDAATRHVAGTGLGLSIVRDFATLLGGRVSVGDAPEGGALFTLDLPATAPAAADVRVDTGGPPPAREVRQAVETREPAPDDQPETAEDSGIGLVLVVEDHRDMNRVIAEDLVRSGFRVLTAFDGREGYQKAIEHRPDLVLTDIMMPGMRGDELLRALRKRPELNMTPIVVLTAKTDQDLRIGLLKQGAQDYLDKPFSLEELRARVRNLVARKRAEDTSSRLRQQLEDVASASLLVSEAIAGVPSDSVQAVLETTALNARTLVDAEFAAAGIGGDEHRSFDIWAAVGMHREQMAELGRPPRPIGSLALPSRQNRAIRLRDLRENPEHGGFPPNHPLMTSFLGVPIQYRGRPEGMLYLTNKRGADEFTEHDERLVEMLADRVGVALETARLYAAEGKQREWLQAVVDQMPNGVVLMDASGKVTIENRSAFALAAGETQGRDRFGNPAIFDLRRPSGEPLPLDDVPIVKAITRREITQGEEVLARCADGRLVPLIVSAAPIRTTSPEPAGAVMILQDISVLKQLERTREEWASIIAHDLQQPITAIAMKSELLLRAQLDDKARNDVRQMLGAAKRLSRMVGDLMDASLLESHRLSVTLSLLDLGALVQEVVEAMPEAARRTDIHTPADRHLYVKGDPQRLEQVLTNLLSNAVKYGTPDTRILVDVRERDGNADVLVTNQGPGISSGELPVIFERYTRSTRVRTTAKGSGLGLYIAKGLIAAQGGHMRVDSTPGDTTTFSFTLPLEEEVIRDARAS